jgi:hypothetical protein
LRNSSTKALSSELTALVTLVYAPAKRSDTSATDTSLVIKDANSYCNNRAFICNGLLTENVTCNYVKYIVDSNGMVTKK